MGFFGNSNVRSRIRDRSPVTQPGPLTARQALAALLPAVEGISHQYRLGLVTSGEDIDAEGRSARWEFLFDFPSRKALGMFGIEPCDIEASETALCLTIDVSPGVPSFEQPLPLEFKDSPQAAAELAMAGVDWVAGSTRMMLASRRLPGGKLVWYTEMFGREYTTPFPNTPPGR